MSTAPLSLIGKAGPRALTPVSARGPQKIDWRKISTAEKC